jgi:hypothetical protein
VRLRVTCYGESEFGEFAHRKINASVRLDVVDDFDQPSPFTDVTS